MEELRADIRRLRQRMAAKARRRDSRSNLSQWTLQTALLIALALNYDFTAAAEWLVQKKRRGTQLAEDSEPKQIIQMVGDAF